MKKIYFNNIITKLNNFWKKNDCIILQPIDKEVGAATYHPTTFINAINNKKWNAAYTQISKRPSDIQNNKLSNKSIIFHQYQVIMKPSPKNIKDLYLNSLKYIGINIDINEIKFIEDNWKSPSLGAFGIGWEIRLNGIEVTQFTYFQQMGEYRMQSNNGRNSIWSRKINNAFTKNK
ncbi:MAG TPA: glycine--tRNA ligase subunit alpha [Candidatus Azoamicus sp.]